MDRYVRLDPAADRRLLVLWDIDHTLVDTRGVSREAYEAAFIALTSLRAMPPVEMTGRTDRAIMGEVLTSAGVAVTASTLRDFRSRLGTALRARRGELVRRGRALPGAGGVLSALGLKSPWVVQTVLTGNIPATAATKLLAFGLDIYLDLTLGAYGGHRLDRADLVDDARGAFAERYPAEALPHVVIVGDSVHDVDCARRRGARCVATATGRHTAVSLAAAGADVVLPSLQDIDGAVDAICDWNGGRR
jgi:phosphoglycolate phosphatase